MSRNLTNALLGIVALAAVAIAAVLIYSTFVATDSDDRGGVDKERREARAYFEDEPDFYCTFPINVYPGETIPECEARRVKDKLRAWEKAGRPDPSTINLP